MKGMKKWDKLIIAAILIIGIPSILAMLTQSKVKNQNIIIKVENKVVKTIPLSSEKKIYDFKFGDSFGYIELKDGAVRMLEMDKKICPEGICSETGWINKSYQTIVCLPNKIVVSFEQPSDNDIDEISF
jgi:hypothetical protein